jgi:transcriptional regulator with XRE-family HTH domain
MGHPEASMPKSPEKTDLIAILKCAVEESGLSMYELARKSGVSQSQLSRFMRGERALSLESASKLFEPLGLKVVREPPPPAPPAKGRRPKGEKS